MPTTKEKKKKAGVPRLLEISGEKRSLLILSCALSIASTLLHFIPFVAVYFIVQELLSNAAAPAGADTAIIAHWGVLALAALVLALLTQYAATMASHTAAFRILYNLRLRLAAHLAKLPMGYHTANSSGAIKKVLEFSVERIEKFIAHQISDFVSALALPVIMLGAMFALDWRLALACSAPIVAAFMMQSLVFYTDKSKAELQEYQASLEEMNATGVEYVRGMPAVKVFGLTVSSFLRFHDSIKRLHKCTTGMAKTYRRPMSLFVVILASLLNFILPVGIFILSGDPANQAFALTLLLFLTLAPGLSVPVLRLLYLGSDLRQVAAGVERVDEILGQPPMAEPAIAATPQGYGIEFDNVSFSYARPDDANAVNALEGVSFTANEKEMTAVVGPSGSGKSTIASLISRFWDVSSGSIRIGGRDIRELGTEALMQSVSFVFQDVRLFYDTIEENIRMGNNSAAMDDVVEAAKLARCHEFIEHLPQGYKTRIGEGGTHLSGGEAQRVAIARAILKNSPVLVLDEATAFADPENEVKIQQGLGALIKDKTVIIIAHRLSSIVKADKIIVVNAGRVAEQGRHGELLAQGGLYRQMWEAHIDAGAWALEGAENAGCGPEARIKKADKK